MKKEENKKQDEEELSIEEDVEKTLEELKSTGIELSEKEIEHFKKVLTDLAKKQRESAFKKVLRYVAEYLLRFGLIFVISTITMGFFMYFLVLQDKLQMVLVTFTISLILTVLEIVFDHVITKRARHSFTLYLLFLITLVGFTVAFNYFDYKVFNFASIWILYYAIVMALYLLVNYAILKHSLRRR